jgi:hypothetical protein
LSILIVHKPQKVPAGVNKGVHGVGLALGLGATAVGACALFEFLFEERISVVVPLGKDDGELFFRHGDDAASFAVDYGDGTSPESLS